MHNLIVIGGGEFARVVIEAARGANWNVLGFVDPRPCEETVERVRAPWLGDDDTQVLGDHPNAKAVLAVGNVKADQRREIIVRTLRLPGGRWASIIDPRATVSPTATVRPGAIVLAGAVVCSGAVIGEHAIINIGAMVDHDVKVGQFVHVAPGAALGGGSSVFDGAYIGMGARVRDHVHVMNMTTVGMGAVVTKAHPPGCTLVGTPAKPLAATLARAG